MTSPFTRRGAIRAKSGSAVIAAVAIAAVAAATMEGQAQAPLIVAYMTSHGELVPVARYDGAVWRNTWPEPIPNDAPLPVRTVRAIPTRWLGQRVPLSWTTWSLGTGKQQRVTVTGVDRDGSCVESISLATDFSPNPRSTGLAFSRSTPVDEIVEVEEGSSERLSLRREVTAHFRTAIATAVPPPPDSEQGEIGTRVFAVARGERIADETVVLDPIFRDPRLPVFFIEAQRRFDGIPPETGYDALSYGGWFRRDRAGALVAMSASLVPSSSAEGKLPRYTSVAILRLGARSIWVMSEWGKESHAIVLFEISATGVKKLTSAEISGC